MASIHDVVLEAFRNQSRIEAGTGATALQSIRAHEKMERARVAAEDRAGIRALTGEQLPADGEDLGDVILGDNSTYVTQHGGQFGQLAGKALLAAAIASGVGIPATILGTAWLNRPQPPQVTPIDTDTDTRTELQILR